MKCNYKKGSQKSWRPAYDVLPNDTLGNAQEDNLLPGEVQSHKALMYSCKATVPQVMYSLTRCTYACKPAYTQVMQYQACTYARKATEPQVMCCLSEKYVREA